MIPAERVGGQLLRDIERTVSDAEALHVWWLGQSGFLLASHGRRVLLDPYLSDSLTLKYAGTDKPHIRMTQRCIEPAKLTGIDVVTSSHNHTDHLDRDTLVPLIQANPEMVVIVPAANRELAAERLGVPAERLLPLDDGESCAVRDVTFHGVASAHEQVERDELGRSRFLGFVLQIGPWVIYHSGDTVRYEGLSERLRPLGIDLALLPINGRAPERRVAGNLWGEEAARLAFDIQAEMVIPCHYEMFTFNTDSPDRFENACRQLGQAYQTLRCGGRCTLRAPALS